MFIHGHLIIAALNSSVLCCVELQVMILCTVNNPCHIFTFVSDCQYYKYSEYKPNNILTSWNIQKEHFVGSLDTALYGIVFLYFHYTSKICLSKSISSNTLAADYDGPGPTLVEPFPPIFELLLVFFWITGNAPCSRIALLSYLYSWISQMIICTRTPAQPIRPSECPGWDRNQTDTVSKKHQPLEQLIVF